MKTYFASALMASIAVASDDGASSAAAAAAAAAIADTQSASSVSISSDLDDLMAAFEAAMAEAESPAGRANVCHNSDGYSVSSSQYYVCVNEFEHDACREVCHNWCKNSWYV